MFKKEKENLGTPQKSKALESIYFTEKIIICVSSRVKVKRLFRFTDSDYLFIILKLFPQETNDAAANCIRIEITNTSKYIQGTNRIHSDPREYSK